MNKLKRTIFSILLILIGMSSSFAQCAMCRGSVESSVSAGETTMAANLNIGILYLFFAPYLLVGFIAYIWYKSSRKNVKKIQAVSSITR